ncbi:hypothetical protein L1049_011817 [Liquidambar formosana]|uniref:Uncharacterized protein n=1 Tax=Liquidambar formosana TaxID=63359 RepID=A0AAP0WXA9_LIQFO
MFIMSQKLKVLRKSLRKWNWEVFGDINLCVEHEKRNLEAIQLVISNLEPSNALFATEDLMKWSLAHALKVQEIFWKEKSRAKWIQEGDRNTA